MTNYVDLLIPEAVPADGYSSGFEALNWAKIHCPSYITNDAIQKQGQYYYRFYFGKEQDQIVFTLRWL